MMNGERLFASPPSPIYREYSYSENSTHSLRQVDFDGGQGPVALNRSVREGGMVPSCVFAPAPPSSTLLLEREGIEIEPNALSRPFEQQLMMRHLSEYTRDMLKEEVKPVAIPACTSSTVKHLFQIENDELSHQNFGQRHDAAEVPKSKQPPMLHLQSGIGASLEETENTSETNGNADEEAKALSHAVKASKATFHEECLKQELHDALEKKMIEMILAESLSGPVKKSKEELLIDEALKRSLSDPVQKSEEQLFEEARENSLKDIEMIESLRKAEEELVDEAKRKSLRTTITMSDDEELIKAVKRQSLKSLFEMSEKAVGKQPTHASMPMNRRQSTCTTHPLSYAEDEEDDISECNSSMDFDHPPPPSRFDSPLKGVDSSDLLDLDRKMPALVLPASETCDDDDDMIGSLINPNVASESEM